MTRRDDNRNERLELRDTERSQRRFRRPEAFRLEASRLVVERGYSCAEAARRMSISPVTLANWIKAFRKTGQLPPEGQLVPEAEELKRLRKENDRLHLENRILKKAAAYFAKDSL